MKSLSQINRNLVGSKTSIQIAHFVPQSVFVRLALNCKSTFTLVTDPGSYNTYQTQTNEKRKPNERETNERFTWTIRKTHDTRSERTINETNAWYTNERTKWNEQIIRKTQTNEQYTKRTHDTRTNELLKRNHILSNDKRSWFYRSTIQYSFITWVTFVQIDVIN